MVAKRLDVSHPPLLPDTDCPVNRADALQMGALGEAAPLTRQQHLKRIRYTVWTMSWLLVPLAPCSRMAACFLTMVLARPACTLAAGS
jgi:hypothetical protein